MEKDEPKPGKHADTPSESRSGKHINSPDIEKKTAENVSLNQGSSKRQKEWQREIEQGEQEKRSNSHDRSQMPLDEDDTMGIP